jgi:peptidoglycan/LPS O-acetylase OafA/YrhL
MSIESRPKGEIHSLQALRAVAAGLIALGHLDNYAIPIYLTKGFSWIGVDIFFVLSGFIVAYTFLPHMQKRGAWLLFLKKRAARIFPFYWVACLLALLVAALTGYKAGLPEHQLIASFTLFPQKIGEQLIPVAWTLNYEGLFYVITAGILLLAPKHFTKACWLWLVAVILAQPYAPLEPRPYFSWAMFFANAYQFEFLCGILAGYAYLGKTRLPELSTATLRRMAWLSLLIILAALAWGYAAIEHPQKFGNYVVFYERCLLLGVTFGIIIYALAELEKRHALPAMPQWLLSIGGASYVLYLLHDLIFVLLGTAWQSVTGTGILQSSAVAIIAFCVVATALTIGVSIFAARHIERPLTRGCKKLIGA